MIRLSCVLALLLMSSSVLAQNTHEHVHVHAPVAQQQPIDHSQHMAIETAPASARDPHEYSAGYTHRSGPYAYQGRHPMMLADEHTFVSVLGDRFEYSPDNDSSAYELQAWFGDSFKRLVLKTHGSFSNNGAYENQTEFLLSKALGAYFNTQAGLRVDTHKQGKDRQWLAAGIQGLAPYWFELDATAYIGSAGQTELMFDSEYDLLLTQRLILQPRLAFTLRGKNDSANQLGSGLSAGSASLRLRYEFSRQLAPFIGVESERFFGQTAKLKTSTGEHKSETKFIAGLRFWF